MISATLRCAWLAALLIVAVPGAAFAQPAVDALSRVPTQEIPRRQIGWFVNRSYDAFTAAVETEKPLIVVFAYGSPAIDEPARRMASHLKLTGYPTISVIAPRTDKLTEIYLVEGFYDTATIGNGLERVLIKENYWPKGMARPGVLSTHVLAYPGLACSWAGAKRLSTVAAAPPP